MTSDGFHIQKVKVAEPARRGRWRLVAAAVLTALVAVPLLHAVIRARQADLAAQDALWKVDGPPCQALDPARFASVSTPPMSTPYEGTVFQRHGGAMSCTHRVDKIDGASVRYPVCKFSSPDYLSVVVNGKQTFYDLTMGRSASVSVVNGQVRCAVMSGAGT